MRTLIKLFPCLFISLVLTACNSSSSDSGGSNDNTNTAPDIDTSTDTPTGCAAHELFGCYEECPSTIASSAGVIGDNHYIFEVPSGDCLGVVSYEHITTTIPISVNTAETGLSIASTINISTGSRENYFSVEITNNSDVHYCGLRLEDALFYDSEGNLLAETDLDIVGGDTLTPFESRCIVANSTRVFFGDIFFGIITFENIYKELVSNIARVVVRELHGRDENPLVRTQLDSLAVNNLVWDNGSGFPTIRLEVINNQSYTIELDDDAHRLIFLDENDFVVSQSYAYLYEGLGVDESELDDEDYIINPGETIYLNDDIADVSEVYPARATKAILFLEWQPY